MRERRDPNRREFLREANGIGSFSGMNASGVLLFAASGLSAMLGFAVSIRGRRSFSNVLFLAGMLCLACVGGLNACSVLTADVEKVVSWKRLALLVNSFLPAIWLCFSLTYSRGNYREFLNRWQLAIGLAFLVPIVVLTGFLDELVASAKTAENGHVEWIGLGWAGQALQAFILVSAVVILTNLEKTFRTAVGTMRWRIKFVVLGLCVIFGAKIYTASQALLYSGVTLSFGVVEGGALLIGCVLIGISYLRGGRVEIDVYPSQAFLYSSITVVVAGVYLLVVGMLARLVVAVGGDTAFPIKSFLVLVGIVALAVVLLSDRVRQKSKRFISRHFQRPLYDYRNVWRSFTEGTTSKVERTDLCRTVATFVSGLFQVLSVTVWLVDREKSRLTFGASTSLAEGDAIKLAPDSGEASEVINAFAKHGESVDMETVKERWAVTLRRLTPGEFRKGGHRICVPILTGGELLGLMTLGDRVSGIPFSLQDNDLLKCIADQTAACLRNIQLSTRLMQAREMEAFQTMSAFFVHDLKNTASTLSLMLRNLPVHFNDPAFREDALRGISNTVNHINSLIERLTMLRQQLAIKPVETDLNELVTRTLKNVDGAPGLQVTADLRPIPKLLMDPEQIQKVLLNLLLNATEAVGKSGEVRVQTSVEEPWSVVTVSDNGCGISPEFIQRSLFRPFQTTKKRGIGIGMFQSKMIVEAHAGRIEVQSELGKGTTFRVFLPSRSN